MVDGENFIVPAQKRMKKNLTPAAMKELLVWKGCQFYNVDERRQEAILGFLNIKGEKGVLEYTKRFGPLGLYWYYAGAGAEHVPLKVFWGRSLEQIFWGNKGKAYETLVQLGITNPPIDEGEHWTVYREPAALVLDEVRRFLLYYEMLKKGEAPQRTLPAKIGFMEGKPYWVPNATTLIEYIYAWLPVLLSGGLTLRLCENEECRKYFVGKGKHCTVACKNAQNQREKRQRDTIMRRLGRGLSLEEAAAGYDMAKVRKWLDEGLIFLPAKGNYSREE